MFYPSKPRPLKRYCKFTISNSMDTLYNFTMSNLCLVLVVAPDVFSTTNTGVSEFLPPSHTCMVAK